MMKDRRNRRGLPLLALFLLVAGCDGGEQPSQPADTSPEGPGITGMLMAENGEALSYVNVMACTPEVCYYTDTDGTGRFQFLFDSPGNFLIKTAEDLASRPRRTSPMVPVTVVGDEIIDVGDVYGPTLPEDAPVGADGAVAAGDGLTLLFDPDSQDMPPAVAARRVPASMVPEYPASPSEHLIAVYALHPLAWKTDVPIGVRVELDPGAAIVFRTIDEIDGRFSDPIPGRTSGGFVVTLPGTGITSLTHLVVFGED
jgi:hypothetical protein